MGHGGRRAGATLLPFSWRSSSWLPQLKASSSRSAHCCSEVGLRLSGELQSSRNEERDYGPGCAENQPTQGLTWPMLGSIDYEERYERYVSDGQRTYQIPADGEATPPEVSRERSRDNRLRNADSMFWLVP